MPLTARRQSMCRTASVGRSHVSDVVLLAGLTVLLIAGVRGWEFFGLGFPRCWFLQASGVPCPSCGSTRALLALGHADVATALLRNPLVTFVVVFLLLRVGLAVLEKYLGSHFLDPVRRIFTARRVILLVGALVLLNWGYLMIALPR